MSVSNINHGHHHQHQHHHVAGGEQPTFGLSGPHAHGDEFTANNKQHWDQFASKYTEQQWQKDMIQQINDFIAANMRWIGVKSADRVLDYACGPGTITNAIGGNASHYQGVDLSDNMVKAYNLRFESETAFTAQAVVGNLLEDNTPAHLNHEQYFNFDFVAIGLGFHHFENLELCLKRLQDRLKSGGTLLILDMITHAPEEAYKTIVAHAGFSEEQIKRLFTGAGLVDVDIVLMDKEVMMHGTKPRQVFMAKGKKL